MEEDGLYLRIGRRVANFAPGLARIALAMPAAFTRWVQGRLLNRNTIIGVFLVGLLTLAVGLPIAGLNDLYLHGPSNKEIFNFSSAWWISLLKWMGQNNEFDLLWVGFGVILIIAIIPWVLKFYLWVVFSSLGFVIWWLVFLTIGYDLTTIVDPAKAEQPITPKASLDSAQGLQSRKFPQTQAVAEQDSASPGQEASEIHSTESFSAASPSVEKADGPIASPTTLQILDANHFEMKSRIQLLLSDLRGRQETNLGLGMLFSIVGVIILAGLVFYGTNSPTDKTEFLLWFIPRLSIVIFIQVFAYFFLGLYRGNLTDIKYFNNELTNMEYKRMGAEVALLAGNSENPLVPQLCLELLKVERNFVLRKGESAIEPRENKESVADGIDWKQTTNAIKALTEILEKKFG
jgi:hypothetical protein